MKNTIHHPKCPRCGSRSVKAGIQRYVSGNKIIRKQKYKCTHKSCSHYFT